MFIFYFNFKVFKLMGSLEEVVMPQNGIYHEGLTALADAFSNNPNLRILNHNLIQFVQLDCVSCIMFIVGWLLR